MVMDARQKLVSLLRSIGLNQYEAQAYASLLLFGEATAGELSNRAEVPRPRVYDIINRLEKKGFVIVEPGRPVKYRAVAPKQAIDAYLKIKEDEFKKEVERIKSLAEQIEREHGQRASKDESKGVWVLNSDNVLRAGLQGLLTTAKEHAVVTLNPDFLAEYGNTILPAVEDAVNNGISVTLVVPKGMRSNLAVSGDVDVVETDAELPPTVIVDDKKAFLAIPGDKKGILLDHPEFTKSLKAMLEPHIGYI